MQINNNLKKVFLFNLNPGSDYQIPVLNLKRFIPIVLTWNSGSIGHPFRFQVSGHLKLNIIYHFVLILWCLCTRLSCSVASGIICSMYSGIRCSAWLDFSAWYQSSFYFIIRFTSYSDQSWKSQCPWPLPAGKHWPSEAIDKYL